MVLVGYGPRATVLLQPEGQPEPLAGVLRPVRSCETDQQAQANNLLWRFVDQINEPDECAETDL